MIFPHDEEPEEMLEIEFLPEEDDEEEAGITFTWIN